MTKEQKFYMKKLDILTGGKITMPIHDNEEFFGLRIEKDKKIYSLWFYSDDEASEIGSFDIILEGIKK